MSEVCDGWEAAAHAEQEADGRHQGRYEGATEEGTQPHRRGSLVADAVSVGAATVAAGGTPGEAGVDAQRKAREGGASEADAQKAAGLAAGAAVVAAGGTPEEAAKAADTHANMSKTCTCVHTLHATSALWRCLGLFGAISTQLGSP